MSLPQGKAGKWNGSSRFPFIDENRGVKLGHRWVNIQRENGSWDGNRTTTSLNPRIKLSQNLSLQAQFRLDDVRLPTGSFSSKVSNIRVNYNFTNDWLTSTTLQYDSIQDLVNLNFRLNWIYRRGDDLFVVYNQTRRAGQTDRAFILKFTHSFDFGIDVQTQSGPVVWLPVSG